METTAEEDIETLRLKIKEIQHEEDVNKKTGLISDAYGLHAALKDRLENNYPLGYKRDRFLKQLDTVDKKIQGLEKEAMEELRFRQRVSVDLGLDEDSVRYNPRLTVQQNLLRSVLVQEFKQSKAGLIGGKQLEEIAERMQKVKEVYEQIGQLVNEQGLALSIIEENNLKTLNYMRAANKQLAEANYLQGGDKPKENDQPRESYKSEKKPSRKTNGTDNNDQGNNNINGSVSKSEDAEQIKKKKQGKEKVKVIRHTMRGFFGTLGLNIKNFFKKLFGIKEKSTNKIQQEMTASKIDE